MCVQHDNTPPSVNFGARVTVLRIVDNVRVEIIGCAALGVQQAGVDIHSRHGRDAEVGDLHITIFIQE